MRRPNGPGVLGYVVAALASFAAFGTLVGLVAMFAADDPAGALAILVIYVPVATLVAGTFGLPVAVVGSVLLALCLRDVGGQGWHVLTAGALGVVLTLAYFAVLGDVSGVPIVLASAVGVAAAVGRLAVVPLVSSRRRLAAEGRLTGTARW